jgi:predicted deacetylase
MAFVSHQKENGINSYPKHCDIMPKKKKNWNELALLGQPTRTGEFSRLDRAQAIEKYRARKGFPDTI